MFNNDLFSNVNLLNNLSFVKEIIKIQKISDIELVKNNKLSIFTNYGAFLSLLIFNLILVLKINFLIFLNILKQYKTGQNYKQVEKQSSFDLKNSCKIFVKNIPYIVIYYKDIFMIVSHMISNKMQEAINKFLEVLGNLIFFLQIKKFKLMYSLQYNQNEVLVLEGIRKDLQ
ncbi:hypothetical protein [Campylobacter sp.]|uniref:hypothetical protein n=1 Tax=Campylobacter sp. TaxID=205 RepID=UPI0025C22B4D|nr:hypothetical protein [Campylobacter sp.]